MAPCWLSDGLLSIGEMFPEIHHRLEFIYLDRVVAISSNLQSGRVGRPGFGLPLVLWS